MLPGPFLLPPVEGYSARAGWQQQQEHKGAKCGFEGACRGKEARHQKMNTWDQAKKKREEQWFAVKKNNTVVAGSNRIGFARLPAPDCLASLDSLACSIQDKSSVCVVLFVRSISKQ